MRTGNYRGYLGQRWSHARLDPKLRRVACFSAESAGDRTARWAAGFASASCTRSGGSTNVQISPERRPRSISRVSAGGTRRLVGRSGAHVGGGYQERPCLLGILAETHVSAYSLSGSQAAAIAASSPFQCARAKTGRRGRNPDAQGGGKRAGQR